MKPSFLDIPQRHTRARSLDQSPADYACAVQRFEGSRPTSPWAVLGLVIAVAVAVWLLKGGAA